MKFSRTQWNILIAVILIAGFAWTAASRAPLSAQATRDSGRRATPDFTLDTLDGGQFTLSAQVGRPVIVNFWATWCPPCRAELPAFEEVHRAYRDQGLIVVGVDVAESPQVVAQYVQEVGLTFPIALDARGEVTELYRIQGMPTTLFVGRDGKIKDVVIGGPLTRAAIESRISELMK